MEQQNRRAMHKKAILIIYILLITKSVKSQSSDCDFKMIYSKCFVNFVNFKDTIQYNLYNNSLCADSIDSTKLILYLIDKNNNKDQFGNLILPEVVNSEFAVNTTIIINKNLPVKPSIYSESEPLKRGNSVILIPTKILFIYFINALYESNFMFQNNIALSDNKHIVEVEQTIDKSQHITYKVKYKGIIRKGLRSIRKWEKFVAKNGIKYTRENNISPLYYSNIKWVRLP
ncbi:MAG: hypothetical protein ABI723_11330 [Bacteroidia bacterium]